MIRQSICVLAIVALASGPAVAQSTTTGPPAPKDKAMDLPLDMLQAVAREIAAKGQITQRVLEGGTFSVNVRHIAGAETALQHGKIAEVWVVRDGSRRGVHRWHARRSEAGGGRRKFSASAVRDGVERQLKPAISCLSRRDAARDHMPRILPTWNIRFEIQ